MILLKKINDGRCVWYVKFQSADETSKFFLQRAHCYQLIQKTCHNNNQSFNILLKSILLIRDKEKCIVGHVISAVFLA